MDIKSIVRVFRFNELQAKAQRDPDAKRPPTVKFLGLALVLGAFLVLISFWSAPQPEVKGAVPLAVSTTDADAASNETTAPTTEAQAAPQPQSPPAVRTDATRTDPH